MNKGNEIKLRRDKRIFFSSGEYFTASHRWVITLVLLGILIGSNILIYTKLSGTNNLQAPTMLQPVPVRNYETRAIPNMNSVLKEEAPIILQSEAILKQQAPNSLPSNPIIKEKTLNSRDSKPKVKQEAPNAAKSDPFFKKDPSNLVQKVNPPRSGEHPNLDILQDKLLNRCLSEMQLPWNESSTDITPNATADKIYDELKFRYCRRLSYVPRHSYKPRKAYIDFGPPIWKLDKVRPFQTKLILFWTTVYGLEPAILDRITCPGKQKVHCVLSTNRTLLLQSDAVIIHTRDVKNISELPQQRLPHQRWVHYGKESPYYARTNPAWYDGVFNFTVGYRFDTDVRYLHITYRRRKAPLAKEKYEKLINNILSGKTKLLAYMNSHCKVSTSIRLHYVHDLQKHIPVDIYGVCGPLTCERNSKACERKMGRYKFYMAMENSHCRDYITEKVREPLYNWHAVPVVMGGADPSDYERLLPKGSYIHTSGFNSTKELADYLLLLDRNPHLYEKYHRWRLTYRFYDYLPDKWCGLCQKIHDITYPVQIYRDFKGWYRDDPCKA